MEGKGSSKREEREQRARHKGGLSLGREVEMVRKGQRICDL